MDFTQAGELRARIHAELEGRLFGLDDVIDGMLVGLISRGHVLLTGVPGLAKTMLVSALGNLLDLRFRRVQFTPDLMPGDIVGSEVLDVDPATGRREFRFVPGPVFCNLLLADEINRTPPRTQAALLEAMQERSVTVGNSSYPLEPPFIVFATMNPLEQEGTYVLPEAELDRFLLQIKLQYPSAVDEERIAGLRGEDPLAGLQAITSSTEVLAFQGLMGSVSVPEVLIKTAVQLSRETRPESSSSAEIRRAVRFGAGPRASQALVRCAAARALLHGRPTALLEDLGAVATPVLRHRMVLNFEALAEGLDVESLLPEILERSGLGTA